MKKGVLALICSCLLIPSVSWATANMRDYIPAPPDTFLSMLYYNNVNGDELYVDGNKAANVELSQNLFLLREVYFTKIGSIVADPQFILPFGNSSFDGLGQHDRSDGIGDLILLCTFWPINNPETKTYLGITPYIYLPTGDYDEDQVVNLGANRYAFQAEVGFVKGWEIKPGHNLFLEISPSVFIYGDNDDYMGGDLSQDPVFALESHLSYDLTANTVVGLSYYGQWGGELDGDAIADSGDTKLNNHTIGAQVAFNFAPGWQFLMQYKQDVSVDYGVKAQVVQGRLFYAVDFNSLFD